MKFVDKIRTKFWNVQPSYGSGGVSLSFKPSSPVDVPQWPENPEHAIRRSRELYALDSYTRKFVRLLQDHCSEIEPRFPSSDRQQHWSRVSTQPLIGSYMGWRDFMRLLLGCWAVDGEVFLWMQRDQWVLIDPLQIHHRDDGEDGLLHQGIRYNRNGYPVAYLVHDKPMVGGNVQTLPASEVLHLYERTSVSQRRGTPWVATAEGPLGVADLYEKALLTNAWAAASMPGFLAFPEKSGLGPLKSDYDDIAQEAVARHQADVEEALSIKPGQLGNFPEGTEYVSMSRGGGYRSTDYDSIRVGALGRAGAGLGISYYALAGDTRSANYSSLRFASLDDEMRYNVVRRMMREAIVRMMRMWGINRTNDLQWAEPPYRSVDPVKDAAANKILVELGVKSKAEVIRERGKDPAMVMAEIESEGGNEPEVQNTE